MKTVDLHHVDKGPLANGIDGAGKPPLLLIHGADASARTWEYVLPAFVQTRRVIAPSLRGCGMSPGGGTYSVAAMAADVWALLERLNVGLFDLVGHSMGGAVALQMAVDQPERVCRAVFADTLPSFAPDTPAKRWLFWSRVAAMFLFGPQRLTRSLAKRVYPGTKNRLQRMRVIDHGGASHNRLVYLRMLYALQDWQVMDQLQHIRCPALVLAAEDDYFPQADAERFAKALPDGQLQIVPGGHHQLPLQMPEYFIERVQKFLEANY